MKISRDYNRLKERLDKGEAVPISFIESDGVKETRVTSTARKVYDDYYKCYFYEFVPDYDTALSFCEVNMFEDNCKDLEVEFIEE